MSKAPWWVGPSSPTRPARSMAKTTLQLLQADVVDDLVVGALQEGRVDRHHRPRALQGQAAGQQDRLLLGDADVEVAVGQLALEDVQAGAGVHGRGDAEHPLVALALATSALPNTSVYWGIGLTGGTGRRPTGRRAAGDRLRLGGVPLLHALQAALLGGGKALALDRGAVHDDGPLGGQGLAQRAAHRADVVAVDDAHVGPVELLPPQTRRPEGLERLLDVGAEALEGGADAGRQLGQAALEVLAGVPQARVEAHAVEVARQRADVGRDRHAVVVEQHDDRGAEAAGLMDGLEGHAAGHRPVADDGDDLAVLAVAAAHGLLDPDRVADRRRGVAGAHDVVLGLGDRAERGQALVLADRVQLVAAAGQDLVGVGLVADVPEDLVAREIEQRVQRHGDLARAEVGAEVAADLAHRVDDVLAHLLGERLELLVAEPMEVGGAVDACEELGHGADSPL